MRDRNYSPKYELEIEKKKSIETLSLIDQATTWREGVNSEGLMIVSAALNNQTDLDDNGNTIADSDTSKEQLKQHKILKEAMFSKSVDKAVKILKDGRFIGTTFVSDGEKLTILEVYINGKAFDKEQAKYSKEELEKLSEPDQIWLTIKGIDWDDYDVEEHTVKKDTLAIRTNHGKLLPDAGYQKDDEDLHGYKSSTARHDYTKKAIDPLGDDAHPFDILTVIKNLKDVDKVAQNNPIRPKQKPDKDGNLPDYLDACKMIKDAITDSSVGAVIAGPWTIAIALRGATELIRDAMKDPAYVHELMELTTEVAIRFGLAIPSTGAGMSYSEAPASASLISPKMYREFVLPYHKKAIGRLKEEGINCTLHI